jgi:hypothetical protein
MTEGVTNRVHECGQEHFQAYVAGEQDHFQAYVTGWICVVGAL